MAGRKLDRMSVCSGARIVLCAGAVLAAGLISAQAETKAPPAKTPPAKKQPKASALDRALAGSRQIGKGIVTAYTKGRKWLVLLPKAAFRRQFLWYTETVTVPSGISSDNGLSLGGIVVSFQNRGDRVLLRDHTASFGARVGAGRQAPEPGQTRGQRIDPVRLSVRRANEPPVVGVLPVVATGADGSVLVDVTRLFSGDIETMSARAEVSRTGLVPVSVNAAASYITSIRVFPNNFGIRTHLTFIARNPRSPVAAPRGVSMRVGHSLIALPQKPMMGRQFDPRVGYFRTGSSVTSSDSAYTVYDSTGGAARSRGLIMRFRLEKKNPDAAVSDPVKPIVFYIGREVPDRWRPYLKAAVAMWEPALRAAGFSNAIVARDAPTFKENPNWTPEDARYNTIRWISQSRQNATGPHIVDPRSGEILASHVEVWPGVITIFSRYYFAVNAALDSRVTSLPLSQEMQGRMLQYAVAHEVGHALGLRHNHIASTVYTVAQMRNPQFANKWGANASIMAYGRFNQAAQPGDGVTRFIPGIGPYDYYAIKWGYGVFGKTPDEDRKALAAFTARAQQDRRLLWAAGELPQEMSLWQLDPRVLKESTGKERVLATRLGVRNIVRSLGKLDAATQGDDDEFRGAFSTFQIFHMRFLKSAAILIGGAKANPWNRTGPRVKLVPPAQQRAAVRYLLGEGARSLDAYKNPALTSRVATFGVAQAIETYQEELLGDVLDGSKMSVLANQKASNPNAYGVVDLANDTHGAVWGNLANAPPWRRVLQRAYLARVEKILRAERADPSAAAKVRKAITAQGYPPAFANIAAATGANTVFPAWARQMLPTLVRRLDRAAKTAAVANDRLHFASMASRARRLAAQYR